MNINHSYNSGHPWYYVLGSPVLMPKEIMAQVKASGYQGYMAEDIAKADNKPEPQRSEALRTLKRKFLADMWDDLSCYRALARQLHEDRQNQSADSGETICTDIHMGISLKHNHLHNNFAHLLALDNLLSKQLDLFGL